MNGHWQPLGDDDPIPPCSLWRLVAEPTEECLCDYAAGCLVNLDRPLLARREIELFKRGNDSDDYRLRVELWMREAK